MPRTGQIIPKYIQPHEEVYINDNTYYDDIVDNTGGPVFLCVFISGKGRDKLLLKKSWGDFVAEYGYPNYHKWGQAMYIPYTALYSGNAQAQCLRVVAKDSTYANIIFSVGYKISEGKFHVKFKYYTRQNLRTLDDLITYAELIEETDSDGYKWLPIMTFYCLGRGAYGADYRIRLSHDKIADKENDYKNYNIEVLSTEEGTKMIESYNVTFDFSGTDPGTKLTNFVQDVINDEEGSGSKRIGCEFFTDNYQKIFDSFSSLYDNTNIIEPDFIKVDRLPYITPPATNTLYHLTQNDGTYVSGGMYVYDSTNAVFNQSNYSITSVAALPAVASANTNIIYKLTAVDDTVTGGTVGSTWIVNNEAWVKSPSIVDVDKLPSTQQYDEGKVYELTAPDGNKSIGSLWIYDSTSNGYIKYVNNVDATSNTSGNPYTIGTFDLFGYSVITKDNEPLIEIDDKTADGRSSVAIMDLEGIGLASGSDGSFSDSTPKAIRDAAMEQAYQEAFQGSTDKKIMSKRRSAADIILDANYSLEVKKAITSLVTQRMDLVARLDTGLLSDINSVYDFGGTSDYRQINTYLVSKNCGMFKTLDPITGKVIPVTNTLWLASQYPTHYLNYGNYTPLAGENYAVISGYVKGSIKPEIDADDMDIKEKLLVDYKINYIECLDSNTYVRGTQTTSQQESSDLSEENNVLVLLEIKRKIERLTAKRRYRWSEAADLRLFQESCKEVFSTYEGTKCRSINIKVSASKWEQIRYIIHVYLEVVFRTFQKRAIIEIDINPRA